MQMNSTDPGTSSEGRRGSVLIVDDNPNNLRVLTAILSAAGFKTRQAPSGELALRAAQANPPDLLLLDIRMPGLDGYEVCRRLKAKADTREIPVIFISALGDVADKVTAFDAGGVDYIPKPFQSEEVLARVSTHLEMRRLQRDLEGRVRARTEELRCANEALQASEAERERFAERLQCALIHTIEAIAAVIEKRDPFTAGHQRRSTQLAVATAEEMQVGAEVVEAVRLGGLIHDIGKISIPTEILTRPGRLSEMEFRIIRTHPETGFKIVKDVDFPWPVAEMVLQHHERLDGSGYPQGLKGAEIALEARIMAVADVVEAIQSHRPYRPALGLDMALEEIRAGRGTRFDADAVDACIRVFEEQAFSFAPPKAPD